MVLHLFIWVLGGGDMMSFVSMMRSQDAWISCLFDPPPAGKFPAISINSPYDHYSVNILPCDIRPFFTKLCLYSFKMLILMIEFLFFIPPFLFKLLLIWFILYSSTDALFLFLALLRYSFMDGSTVNMNTIGFDSCPLAEALFCTQN